MDGRVFPIQYNDDCTVYLPLAKQRREVHAALQNVDAKTLDKSKSTASPLLLIKHTHINSMLGNFEKYGIVGTMDKTHKESLFSSCVVPFC